jgi:hypothetical protein
MTEPCHNDIITLVDARYLFWVNYCNYYSNELKLMNASLVSKQDYVPRFPSLHNTLYRWHIITVNYNKVSSRSYLGPRVTYFGKLLELLLKRASKD